MSIEAVKVEVTPTQEEKDKGILRKWEFRIGEEVVGIKYRHSTPQGHVPPVRGTAKIQEDLDLIKAKLGIP